MGTPPQEPEGNEGPGVDIDVEDRPGDDGIEGVEDAATDAPSLPEIPALEAADAPARAHILAFAAGRGGTGRSLLAANVAVYLAQTGKKVVAIDCDPAGGSLHLLLGTPRPPRGFGEFLRARVDGLTELIVDTPVAGVGLIGGEGSAFGATRPKQTPKSILAALAALEFDWIVLDLGPPDSTLVLDLWLAADVPILVTLPDPASIEATYRFVKSGFVRRLRSKIGRAHV